MAETADERWRSCKQLGTLGSVIIQFPDEAPKVIKLLSNVIEDDPSGIVRYYAICALGKLAPFIHKKRPDLIFEITNLVLNTAMQDEYDRVRKGGMGVLWVMTDLPSRQLELPNKVREACFKILETEKWDIIRMDCCTIIGKIGPPAVGCLSFERQVKPLEKAYNMGLDFEKELVLNEKLVIWLAKLSLYKLDRVKNAKRILCDDLEAVIGFLVQFEHWSYWPQRECFARAMGQMGSLVIWFPKELDRILNLFEQFSYDLVWDVRAAVCKALGDFAPAPGKGGNSAPGSAKLFQVVGPVLWEKADPILHRGVRDNNADVREAAQEAAAKRPTAADYKASLKIKAK